MNALTIRRLAVCGVVLALVGGLYWLWQDAAQDRDTYKASLAVATADLQQCNKDKQISEEAGRDLENRYGNVANQLDDIKRMRPAKCVPVVTKSPCKPDAATHGREQADGDGLRSEWLYDFAGICEKDRQHVLSLQAFINRVWER